MIDAPNVSTTNKKSTDGKLRILQIHNVQSNRGGADVVIERETELLQRNGHTVIPFLVETEVELSKSKLAAGLKAIWNRDACRQVAGLVRENKPDIAHVHTPFPVLSPAVFRQTHKLRVPTVETLHSHRMICVNALFQREGRVCEECVGHQFPTAAIRHRCYHNSLAGSAIMATTLALHHRLGTFQKCIDRYIALSPFAKAKLIATGFPEQKICVRPNFVESDVPPGDGSTGNVLFVGRLVPEKGILTLVKAWQLLTNPPMLTIIGDGPLRSQLEEETSGCRIEMTGWKTSQEVKAMMRDAALVVFPSEIYEAGPLVLIEAYSCGTPVLASDVGNFSDQVIDGETGTRFRSGDAKSLAEQVRHMFQNPKRLSEMRLKAYDEYLRGYTPEISYKSLMDIYQQAIDCRRSSK